MSALKQWACVRYVENVCGNHKKKNISFIVPLEDVELENGEFDKNSIYNVKCIKNSSRSCKAVIAFITEETTRSKAINLKIKTRLSYAANPSSSEENSARASTSKAEEESDEEYLI
ncbi:uncharacterized protein LOC122502719 [Leptopilina heterotoma]|uniref:uncharacterized protein LOC122502719 n=1 Tax=Leptopilina heterotoma TaxID=63436 RepID=UPI001CA91A1B|nr:uncharacterized protein LOC122502719 [Leptopilina heterotoma]